MASESQKDADVPVLLVDWDADRKAYEVDWKQTVFDGGARVRVEYTEAARNNPLVVKNRVVPPRGILRFPERPYARILRLGGKLGGHIVFLLKEVDHAKKHAADAELIGDARGAPVDDKQYDLPESVRFPGGQKFDLWSVSLQSLIKFRKLIRLLARIDEVRMEEESEFEEGEVPPTIAVTFMFRLKESQYAQTFSVVYGDATLPSAAAGLSSSLARTVNSYSTDSRAFSTAELRKENAEGGLLRGAISPSVVLADGGEPVYVMEEEENGEKKKRLAATLGIAGDSTGVCGRIARKVAEEFE